VRVELNEPNRGGIFDIMQSTGSVKILPSTISAEISACVIPNEVRDLSQGMDHTKYLRTLLRCEIPLCSE